MLDNAPPIIVTAVEREGGHAFTATAIHAPACASPTGPAPLPPGSSATRREWKCGEHCPGITDTSARKDPHATDSAFSLLRRAARRARFRPAVRGFGCQALVA